MFRIPELPLSVLKKKDASIDTALLDGLRIQHFTNISLPKKGVGMFQE